MRMRIALLNPPTPASETWVREGRCQQLDIWGAPYPPLTLASIAGQLAPDGDCLIVDSGPAGLDLEATLGRVAAFGPNLAIVATATPTIATDLSWFADALKHRLPDSRIAAIGIHVSCLPAETLRDFPAVDYILRGEVELTCRELVRALADGARDLRHITGLAFRDADTIVLNAPRAFLEDLDALALPAWPGVDFGQYRLPILDVPFNLLAFARGCPFHCAFCNAGVYYGKKLRRRSPESLIREIRQNIRELGVRDFLFLTESSTLDPASLRRFLTLLRKEGLHRQIRWVSNSRVDVADTGLFREMREAGCWQVAFGLEFGTDRMLRLARKGGKATLATARETVRAVVAAGIVADGHFIMGYPGETADDLRQTIAFARSLPLTFAHFYAAAPFPGSRLYEEAVASGALAGQDWRSINQHRSSLGTGHLDPETVDRFIALAYRRFYFRPRTVLRMLRIPRRPVEYATLFVKGIRFAWDVLVKTLRH